MNLMKHFVLTVFVFFAQVVYSSETINYNIHHQFVTPRSLGAGGTFSGMDGQYALFYNPALVVLQTEKDFNFGISAGTSKDTMDFTKDVSDIVDSNKSDSDKIDDVTALLDKNYGKVFTGRVPSVEFIYARPRYSFAFIPLDLSLAIQPNKPAGPALDVTAYQDTTIAFAFGKSHKNKKISWGVTTKAIYRASVDKTLLALDIIQDSDIIRDSDFKEGLTVDADVGLNYAPFTKSSKISKYFTPSFQLVARNIIDAGFFSNFEVYNDGSSKPENLQRRIDVGTLLELPSNSYLQPRLMVDVRNILHDYFSFTKGLHLGGELKYRLGKGLFGSLQGGYGQGYWSAGLGIQSYILKLELASYAEEYGTKSSRRTDRQYIAQLNFQF